MRVQNLAAAMLFGLVMLCGFGAGTRPAQATVQIQVDLARQVMHVEAGGGESYDWPVSTARHGFVTPRGSYGVQSLQRMHYSRKYHNSPMPYSIFFRGGYAIHGTYEVASLGRAASHGCIRVSPENAATLYQLVAAEGARISIYGSAPADVRYASEDGGGRRHHRGTDYAGRGYQVQPTAYAPMPAPAPASSYDDWMQNPFGSTGY